MEQKEFKYRLDESTRKLIGFTQSIVTNSISDNVEFLIEPNSRETSSHLVEQELNKLLELNRLEGKLLNSNEVSILLYDSGRVPLWINSEVFRSNKNKTTIKLICSRRFREEKDLNHKADEFPPFHPLVPLPPWRKDEEKFNINWRHQTLRRKWYALTWKWRYIKELKGMPP